jgi:transposase
MMGERQVRQDALFYEFSLERHVPAKHLLRSVDRFVELDGVRCERAPFYSEVGRPSIDPELLIRMLIVGYCFGIRSDRRLCEEVHLHLAYRWFCRLGLDGAVPDHSTFSKNRYGRFRDSDLLRNRHAGNGRREPARVAAAARHRRHIGRAELRRPDPAAAGHERASPAVPGGDAVVHCWSLPLMPRWCRR